MSGSKMNKLSHNMHFLAAINGESALYNTLLYTIDAAVTCASS